MNKEIFLNKVNTTLPDNLLLYDYSDVGEISYSNRYKAKIICREHGAFTQSSYAHLAGGNCRKCSNEIYGKSRRKNTTDFISQSKKKFGNRFNYTTTKYIAQNIEVELECSVHSLITITPKHHFSAKTGCCECDYLEIRKARKDKMLLRAGKEHEIKYDYSLIGDIKNSNDIVEIICPTHGSFWQRLASHVYSATDCPTCSRDRTCVDFKTFVARAKKVHGDRYTYSDIGYKSTYSVINIECKSHGIFTQRASSHLEGSRCRDCYIEDSWQSTQVFITASRKIHGSKYDYSRAVYTGSKKPVEIICPTHGSFWKKPNTHLSGKAGCSGCRESKGESAIRVFLEEHKINFIREYRILPHLFRFDFYLPEIDTYIEFNGLQHYRPVDKFGGEKSFLEVVKRDRKKTVLVKESGGTLMVIKHDTFTTGILNRVLIAELKKVRKYWFLIDGKVRSFRTARDVYNTMGIPKNVLVRNLAMEMQRRIPNCVTLF